MQHDVFITPTGCCANMRIVETVFADFAELPILGAMQCTNPLRFAQAKLCTPNFGAVSPSRIVDVAFCTGLFAA